MNLDFLKAVLERDARFDGRFVYGVSSTRIFCRPSCASRRPKTENISIFESIDEAKDAGFRACLRCKPQQWKLRFENASGRELENATGVSAREFGEKTRIERFKTEMQAGKSVLEAQNEAGFGSSRALYERAPTMLGMTPASYGKGGAGAEIIFTLARCELGFILVARTKIGVCSVALGDDEESLETSLRTEFFAAKIEREDDNLRGELEIVLNSMKESMPSPILSLDVRASAFQWRVWQELTRIGRGETVSYGELAARMKIPQSVRAVAAACGKNPVALVHPCHRVVGKNGA
ncbi:MAG TPA: methylated-DNA--[protein]-cysteine S-methyltransferase, partial [Abditibacterium sp.]